MGFRNAVRSALSQYFKLSGRASRSEFWWYFLFYNLMIVGCIIVLAILTGGDANEDDAGWVVLVLIALLPPLFTVLVRRLHDKGLTAWLVLLCAVPFGQIALLILCALPGDAGPNSYGPDPLGRATPSSDAGSPSDYTPSNIPRVEDDDPA